MTQSLNMAGRLRRMASRRSSDYFLSPELKEHLSGTRFSSDCSMDREHLSGTMFSSDCSIYREHLSGTMFSSDCSMDKEHLSGTLFSSDCSLDSCFSRYIKYYIYL
ncbi:hypothetical protein AVEN_241354-1 [Araneus ventricosus]|uniref:Uncharacterized protein n=1 Tax=Araneus ventricosus TaxID=182803 RepID=A0A4Y2IEU5_ARAVE|nr:hypothetical protein AVEN_241354-1 [Araneus ventricosus]